MHCAPDPPDMPSIFFCVGAKNDSKRAKLKMSTPLFQIEIITSLLHPSPKKFYLKP